MASLLSAINQQTTTAQGNANIASKRPITPFQYRRLAIDTIDSTRPSSAIANDPAIVDTGTFMELRRILITLMSTKKAIASGTAIATAESVKATVESRASVDLAFVVGDSVDLRGDRYGSSINGFIEDSRIVSKLFGSIVMAMLTRER